MNTDLIPATGLTTVVPLPQAVLDIVFVHGFTGHPERTWKHNRGTAGASGESSSEPPAKSRRRNPFSRNHTNTDSAHSTVYWPRDLLPTTVPNTRVLTHGYDTNIRHWAGAPVSQNTVRDIAWNLLVALEAERRAEPARPLLFIVHSLGGIVVKEMLLRSSRCRRLGQSHLRNVFISTRGIMFFGTPHGGADPRGIIHHVAEQVVRAVGYNVNDQILDHLLPSSERLRELRDEFGPLSNEQGFIIHSFQEELATNGLGRKVVEDNSSYLNLPDIETMQHITRDHQDMCRFTGPDDPEYKKVAAALDRMTANLERTQTRGSAHSPTQTQGSTSSLTQTQLQSLLDALRFDQIDTRHNDIKRAHAKTCKWLLQQPMYLDWLDHAKLGEHYGILWIKGKPGAGKSTLMKFALANARRTMKDRTVISFFFHARGSDLEKSTIGMYRSLILQIIEKLPHLPNVFDSLTSTTWAQIEQHKWSKGQLEGLFEQAVRNLGQSSLVCFIDALDECDEGQIREMLSFLLEVGNLAVEAGTQFRVCFSSRHYPHITIDRPLSWILEEQEEHEKDIIKYISSELKIGYSNLARRIREELQEKASGVFMWVVLVVQILNKEHDGGQVHALQRRLREIPGDLQGLFSDILTRDGRNIDSLLLCVQWVLFTRQPLTPEQLYFAILSGDESCSLSGWDPNEVTTETIKRFILDTSKGLTEVTSSKSPTIQFIHESVRDFFLDNDKLGDVWPGLGSNFSGQSHERIKQCCLAHLGEVSSAELSNDDDVVYLEGIIPSFPLMEYSIRNLFYHVDAAEQGSVSQTGFIQSFQLVHWIRLHNFVEKHKSRHYTSKASFLYILAEHNMAALIKAHCYNQTCSEVEGERYGTPILAALATGSNAAAQALMDLQLDDASPSGSPLHDLCGKFRNDVGGRSGSCRGFTFGKQDSLSYIVQYGDHILLEFLLVFPGSNTEMGEREKELLLSLASCSGNLAMVRHLIEEGAEVDSRDDNGRTPLMRANTEAVAKHLINKGAQVNSRDKNCRTPLLFAAQSLNLGVARVLLDNGAEVDSMDDTDSTPLSSLIFGGDYGWSTTRQRSAQRLTMLLLDQGAKVDFADHNGRMPLSYVASYGYEDVAGLLLIKGAEVDTIDKWGRSPLWYAASSAKEGVGRLLLDKGADVDKADKDGRTPLSNAASCQNESVVRLLLSKGAGIDKTDKDGRTPLSFAAGNIWGRSHCASLLLDQGAKVNLRDNDGRTPLWWAIRSVVSSSEKEEVEGRQNIVRMLRDNGAVEVSME